MARFGREGWFPYCILHALVFHGNILRLGCAISARPGVFFPFLSFTMMLGAA